MGTLVALLVLSIATLFAIGIIILVVMWWISIVNSILPNILDGWKLG